MGMNVRQNVELAKHPVHEGVFMRHFFGKDETDGRLNNVEISIMPGFGIAEHAHESAGEFFYVVSGQGAFLDQTEWVSVQAGDAFMAPVGMRHAVKSTGRDVLKLFSTFSPPVR